MYKRCLSLLLIFISLNIIPLPLYAQDGYSDTVSLNEENKVFVSFENVNISECLSESSDDPKIPEPNTNFLEINNASDTQDQEEKYPEDKLEETNTNGQVLVEEPPVQYSVLSEEQQVFSLSGSKSSSSITSYRYADQLSERESEIYELLESDSNIAKYHESEPDNGKVVISETFIFSSPHASVAEKTAEYEAYRDSVYAMIRKAMAAFDFDHPEIFWTCGIWYTCARPTTISASAGSMNIEFRMMFPYCWPSDRNLENDEAEFNSIIAGLVSEMGTKNNTFNKLEFLHNWIVKNNRYNSNASDFPETYGYMINGQVVNCSPWSASGALLSDFSPVCEGYSRAFQIVCQYAGIPCVPVVGTGHMWNYVKCGNSWYAVDCTWDDPVTGYLDSEPIDSGFENWKFFMCGSADNSFSSNHSTSTHYDVTFSYPIIENSVRTGYCGESAYWKILNEGCLYIFGSGDMYTYTPSGQPWYPERDSITAVSVSSGITKTGNYAFCGFTSVRTLTLEDGIEAIGAHSFENCSSVNSIEIPPSINLIEEYGFALNTALSQQITVVFLGNITDSDGNCIVHEYAFDGINGEAVYNHSNATWTNDVIRYLKSITPNLRWDNAGLPVFEIESKQALTGREVKAAVILKNNPGISSVVLSVHYDECLTLTGIEYGADLGGQTVIPERITNNPVILNWVNDDKDNTDIDMILAVLTFRVSESAVPGSEAIITASYNREDVYNNSEEKIYFDVINGRLNIISHIPGDINGDYEVNNKDISRLFQYVSGWDVDTIKYALDVNGDGNINNKDVTRLFQYVSGWNVLIC